MQNSQDQHVSRTIVPSDNVTTSTLRDLASLDPVKSLATLPDDELAAMARHLLPDMAAELLAWRLAETHNSADRNPVLRHLPAWMRPGERRPRALLARTFKVEA